MHMELDTVTSRIRSYDSRYPRHHLRQDVIVPWVMPIDVATRCARAAHAAFLPHWMATSGWLEIELWSLLVRSLLCQRVVHRLMMPYKALPRYQTDYTQDQPTRGELAKLVALVSRSKAPPPIQQNSGVAMSAKAYCLESM